MTAFKYIFLVTSPKNSTCVMKKFCSYILYKYVSNIATHNNQFKRILITRIVQ